MRKIFILMILIYCAPTLFAVDFSYDIEAAIHLRDEKAILWGGKEYFRFDLSSIKADSGYPKITKTVLEDFPFDTVDACVVYTSGKAVFFKDDNFFDYNLKKNTPISNSAEKIDSSTWPGMPFKKIDAGFGYRGNLYLFSGKEFVVFDWKKKQTLQGYPKSISGGDWPDLPFDEVGAALNYRGKTVYFFNGGEYAAFDLSKKKAKPGYPKTVKDKWKGIRFVKAGSNPEPEKPEEPVADIGIQFFRGAWNDVLAAAKKDNKPIMVDAYTVWCGPCKWMEENTFTDDKVADYYNKTFVNYRMDMEKGEGIGFAYDYDVDAYPTIIYFDSSGKERYRSVGSRDAPAFIRGGKLAVIKITAGNGGDQVEEEESGKDVTEMVKGAPNGTEIIKPVKNAFEREVLRLANKERKTHGLGPLSWRDDLGYSARYHAADMGIEDYFNHDSFDRNGSKLDYVCDTWERIKPFASSPGAENIAAGQTSAAVVMEGWMNSPGHRANILNGSLKYMGVGYYYWEKSTYGHYWVQNFGY